MHVQARLLASPQPTAAPPAAPTVAIPLTFLLFCARVGLGLIPSFSFSFSCPLSVSSSVPYSFCLSLSLAYFFFVYLSLFLPLNIDGP